MIMSLCYEFPSCIGFTRGRRGHVGTSINGVRSSECFLRKKSVSRVVCILMGCDVSRKSMA